MSRACNSIEKMEAWNGLRVYFKVPMRTKAAVSDAVIVRISRCLPKDHSPAQSKSNAGAINRRSPRRATFCQSTCIQDKRAVRSGIAVSTQSRSCPGGRRFGTGCVRTRVDSHSASMSVAREPPTPPKQDARTEDRRSAGAMATRGALWSFLDLGLGQALGAAVFLVVTRLITPAELGVFTIVVVIVGFTHVPVALGLGEALIQRPSIDEDHRSTAFWANIGLGLVIAAALALSANLLADRFHMPALAPVMRWMSLCPLIDSLATTQLALLRRDLSMAVFAAKSFFGYSAGGAVAIALAWYGWGVWALVAQQITLWSMVAIVAWSFSRWRPRLRFSF